MRNALLALLARGPAHGYELKHAIEEVFGEIWPPINIGQIYTTLGRLERDGLARGAQVEQAHRPNKRVYELTDAGRQELDAWLTAPSSSQRVRDELFTKLILAGLPEINGGTMPGALIDCQRRLFLQSLRELNDLAVASDPETNPAAHLLIEGAMLHLEADLKWLDRCEALLGREARRLP